MLILLVVAIGEIQQGGKLRHNSCLRFNSNLLAVHFGRTCLASSLVLCFARSLLSFGLSFCLWFMLLVVVVVDTQQVLNSRDSYGLQILFTHVGRTLCLHPSLLLLLVVVSV